MRFFLAFFAGVLFVAVLALVPPSLLAILRPGGIKHLLREVVHPPPTAKHEDTIREVVDPPPTAIHRDTIREVVDPPPTTKDEDIAKIKALASKYNLK